MSSLHSFLQFNYAIISVFTLQNLSVNHRGQLLKWNLELQKVTMNEGESG